MMSGASLLDRLRTQSLAVTSPRPEPSPEPIPTQVSTAMTPGLQTFVEPVPIPEGIPAPPVAPTTAAAEAAPAKAAAGAALLQPMTITMLPPPSADLLPVTLIPEEEPGFLDRKIFGKVKVKYALLGGALVGGIFAIRALR